MQCDSLVNYSPYKVFRQQYCSYIQVSVTCCRGTKGVIVGYSRDVLALVLDLIYS